MPKKQEKDKNLRESQITDDWFPMKTLLKLESSWIFQLAMIDDSS